MGATSTQGLGVLVFLVAFLFLGLSLLSDGSVLYGLIFVVGLAASVMILLKAKAMDQA